MLPTSNIFRPKLDTLESKLFGASALCTAVSTVALALIFTQVVAVPLLATFSFVLLGTLGLAGAIYFIANEIIGRRGTSLSNDELIAKLQNDFELLPAKWIDVLEDKTIVKKIFNHVYYTYRTKLYPHENDYTVILERLPKSKMGNESLILSDIINLFCPYHNPQIYSDFLSSATYTDDSLKTRRTSLPGTIGRYFTAHKSEKKIYSECKWTELQVTSDSALNGRQLFKRGTYQVTLKLGDRTSRFSASLNLGTSAKTIEEQEAIFSLLHDIIGGKPDNIKLGMANVTRLGMDVKALSATLETFANALHKNYLWTSRPLLAPLIPTLL